MLILTTWIGYTISSDSDGLKSQHFIVRVSTSGHGLTRPKTPSKRSYFKGLDTFVLIEALRTDYCNCSESKPCSLWSFVLLNGSLRL